MKKLLSILIPILALSSCFAQTLTYENIRAKTSLRVGPSTITDFENVYEQAGIPSPVLPLTLNEGDVWVKTGTDSVFIYNGNVWVHSGITSLGNVQTLFDGDNNITLPTAITINSGNNLIFKDPAGGLETSLNLLGDADSMYFRSNFSQIGVFGQNKIGMYDPDIGTLFFNGNDNQAKFTELRSNGFRSYLVYDAYDKTDYLNTTLVPKQYVDEEVAAVDPFGVIKVDKQIVDVNEHFIYEWFNNGRRMDAPYGITNTVFYESVTVSGPDNKTISGSTFNQTFYRFNGTGSNLSNEIYLDDISLSNRGSGDARRRFWFSNHMSAGDTVNIYRGTNGSPGTLLYSFDDSNIEGLIMLTFNREGGLGEWDAYELYNPSAGGNVDLSPAYTYADSVDTESQIRVLNQNGGTTVTYNAKETDEVITVDGTSVNGIIEIILDTLGVTTTVGRALFIVNSFGGSGATTEIYYKGVLKATLDNASSGAFCTSVPATDDWYVSEMRDPSYVDPNVTSIYSASGTIPTGTVAELSGGTGTFVLEYDNNGLGLEFSRQNTPRLQARHSFATEAFIIKELLGGDNEANYFEIETGVMPSESAPTKMMTWDESSERVEISDAPDLSTLVEKQPAGNAEQTIKGDVKIGSLAQFEATGLNLFRNNSELRITLTGSNSGNFEVGDFMTFDFDVGSSIPDGTYEVITKTSSTIFEIDGFFGSFLSDAQPTATANIGSTINANLTVNDTVVGKVINSTTGFQFNNTAVEGKILRGDGYKFISDSLQIGDIEDFYIGGVTVTVNETNTADTIRDMGGLLTNSIGGYMIKSGNFIKLTVPFLIYTGPTSISSTVNIVLPASISSNFTSKRDATMVSANLIQDEIFSTATIGSRVMRIQADDVNDEVDINMYFGSPTGPGAYPAQRFACEATFIYQIN